MSAAETPTTLLRIAKAIDTAAALHEKSWKKEPGAHNGGYYEMTIDQAAILATSVGDTHSISLITLLLSAAWNDAQDWAKAVIESVDGPGDQS